MKKEGISYIKNEIENDISTINYLIRLMGRHIEKFEAAYVKRDHYQFNILKKEIIQIQKKIHSLIK